MKRAGNNRSHITSNFSHLAAMPKLQQKISSASAIHNGSNLKCVKRMYARAHEFANERMEASAHADHSMSICMEKGRTNEHKKTTIHLNMNTSSGFFTSC